MNTAVAGVKVLQAGLFSTIQDTGRFGLRHLGIPWAGTLTPAWQEIANALVGNDANSPVIECFEGGLQLQAENHDVLLAIVGCETAVIEIADNSNTIRLRANRAYTLAAGKRLTLLSTGNYRHAIVSLTGIDIPAHLGSNATYAKAALGGIDGLPLCADQVIQSHVGTGAAFVENQCQLPDALRYQSSTLRVIAGPQFENFSTVGKATFFQSPYTLGAEADRMGVRLQGANIEHKDSAAKDIVSDAIVPGSIQVPGSGLPIVLLNDAHTAGGYPKIATVISCDLPLLGLQRIGASFHFKQVDIDEAIAATARHRELIDSTIRSLRPCIQSNLDSQTLLRTNLIDGVTDGA